jgi:hypothetical protein
VADQEGLTTGRPVWAIAVIALPVAEASASLSTQPGIRTAGASICCPGLPSCQALWTTL